MPSQEADPLSVSNSEASQNSRKRSAEPPGQADHDTLFPERARTIAMDLGMLSLNSDLPQKHYLGSSSGRLFTDLIGASPTNSQESPQRGDDPHLAWNSEGSRRNINEKYMRSFITLLKQVSGATSGLLCGIFSKWLLLIGAAVKIRCNHACAYLCPLDASRFSLP